MITFYGDTLLRRVTEIIDRVVEAGIYNNWNSLLMTAVQAHIRKNALLHPLDEYYSFKLKHMQPAFFLILMGWCLSILCFVIEVLLNRVLSKRK
jgi:hypothetical protein